MQILTSHTALKHVFQDPKTTPSCHQDSFDTADIKTSNFEATCILVLRVQHNLKPDSELESIRESYLSIFQC